MIHPPPPLTLALDVLWVLIIGATFLTPFSKPDGALSSPAETRARYLRTSTRTFFPNPNRASSTR
jgi:hypothetical protein